MSISKELLSEVLGRKVTEIIGLVDSGRTLDYMCVLDEERNRRINIHELAHKVKEWAYNKHECVVNVFQRTSYNPYIAKLDGKVFQADTETEAIFKTGQWILENK